MREELTDFEWDAIIQGIKDEQCIICLGPEIYSLREDEPAFIEELEAYLRSHQDQLGIRVQPHAWFHFQPDGAPGPVYQAIRSFYRDRIPEESKELLKTLARIKFHMYLSLNPDHYLKNIMEDAQFSHRFDVYTRNKPDRNTEKPSSKLPLVYNILGELDNRNSLVLTFDDFLNYMESVFKGNSMSNMLKINIKEAQYFLFLGIPFDQWFVHLFMRVIEQHKERKTRFAPNGGLSGDDLKSTKEQYNVKFINKGIPGFVEDLFRRCEKEQLVREEVKGAEEEEDKIELWKGFIAKGKPEMAIKRMKEELQGVGGIGKPYLIKLISLESQSRSLIESIQLGILSTQEQIIEKNKIVSALLQLIITMEEDWSKLRVQL